MEESLMLERSVMSRIEDALAKANEKRSAGGAKETGEQDVAINNGAPKRFNCIRTYLLGAAVIIGALLAYFLSINSGGAGGPSKTVIKQTAPVAVQPADRIPSSIPLNYPDKSYSSSHPGWNRYETDAMEFRVFREGGVVRAVQVLARGGKTIPDDFFISFISEISENETFNLHSSDEKGGCIIEKGFAGRVAEVLRYRNKPDGATSAFVVSYL
jgi:hypothetical protein